MRTLLKINGEFLLNFMDLKENFSPAEIFSNLTDFREFARVHCMPLSTCLTDSVTKKKYAASYVNKGFWFGLLTRSQFPPEAGPRGVLERLLDELASDNRNDKLNSEERREAVRKEASDGAIFEKLDAVARGGVQDARCALLMLANSELAEADSRNVSSGEWIRGGQESEAAREPEGFMYKGTAYLPPSMAPYRFPLYEGETLAPGEVIRTVKLAARSAPVSSCTTVELWRSGGGAPEATLKLAPGEYSYVSAVGARIIKFLPSLCVSDDLCAVRADCFGQKIRVKPREGEEWAFDDNGVSFMSAGSDGRGLLLVQNGRVNSVYFRDAEEDYDTSLKLQTITETVVEARITEDGFELLLEDGTTITNSGGARRSGLVSLNAVDPKPLGLPGARECAISESGRSAAALLSGGKYRTYFDGGFSVLNGGRTLKFG